MRSREELDWFILVERSDQFGVLPGPRFDAIGQYIQVPLSVPGDNLGVMGVDLVDVHGEPASKHVGERRVAVGEVVGRLRHTPYSDGVLLRFGGGPQEKRQTQGGLSTAVSSSALVATIMRSPPGRTRGAIAASVRIAARIRTVAPQPCAGQPEVGLEASELPSPLDRDCRNRNLGLSGNCLFESPVVLLRFLERAIPSSGVPRSRRAGTREC